MCMCSIYYMFTTCSLCDLSLSSYTHSQKDISNIGFNFGWKIFAFKQSKLVSFSMMPFTRWSHRWLHHDLKCQTDGVNQLPLSVGQSCDGRDRYVVMAAQINTSILFLETFCACVHESLVENLLNVGQWGVIFRLRWSSTVHEALFFSYNFSPWRTLDCYNITSTCCLALAHLPSAYARSFLPPLFSLAQRNIMKRAHTSESPQHPANLSRAPAGAEMSLEWRVLVWPCNCS